MVAANVHTSPVFSIHKAQRDCLVFACTYIIVCTLLPHAHAHKGYSFQLSGQFVHYFSDCLNL